jgi:hypothetical protein
MNNRLKTRSTIFALIALLLGCARAASPGKGVVPLAATPRSKLCVTKGTIEETKGARLEVKVPEMRAVVTYVTEPVVEAKLTYLGPSAGEKRLGSGELRRQFGLKLRAQNGCNLVYAMWRIAPKSELVVSVKSNPGMSTHAECGTHGYQNIQPSRAMNVPLLEPGQTHTLRAQLDGSQMKVFVDSKTVWEGDIGQGALAFDGPVGVRSDNGRFEFELLTGEPKPGRTGETVCHASGEDE